MSDLETAGEQQLLHAIRRRRILLGLVIVIPSVAVWWLSSRWIAQRWNLQPELVRFVVLLAFSILSVLVPNLGKGLGRDARETPRLRWLNQEHIDQYMTVSRVLLVIGLGGLLLLQCTTLFASIKTETAFSRSDDLVWAVLSGTLCLRWRPTDLGDEGAQLRYLMAVNRAFLVTLTACLAAIVFDAYRGGGILRPAIEVALLIGCLTLLLSLIIGERRAAQDS